MITLPVILIIVFLIEFFILFLSSQLLIQSLARLFYKFTKSQNKTVHLLAFLFLPGTVIHELAHIISAGVMMVHTGDIEFMPEIREDGVKLGSAEIGKTDPIRRALIGMAPVFVGMSFIIGLLWFFFIQIQQNNIYPFWVFLILIYAIFIIANTMFSSRKDMEGSFVLFALIIAFFVAMYLLDFHQVFSFLSGLLTEDVSNFIFKVNLFLVIPICLNFAIFALSKFVLSKGNRRIY